MNHKEELLTIKDNKLYSEIEHLIIVWNIDGTKTAGHLTRQIMELLEKRQDVKSEIPVKKFKTYDNSILIVGEKYKWSGFCESGLYSSTSWKDLKCKVERIENGKIFIYDFLDNKEWEFTNDELRKNMVTFKK